MKKLVRIIAIETISLYLASGIAEGMVFENGAISVIKAGFALTVATFFVRPLINLLLLPLNMVSFGLFKWLNHAVMLYLVNLLLSDFSINGFRFTGYDTGFVNVPFINFNNLILAFIAYAFIISLVTTVIYWFVD